MRTKLIFFDVETNGLKGSSVLSISAAKIIFDNESQEMFLEDSFDRFYFRNDGEEINEKAISVNGLTDEVIEQKRSLSDFEYKKTFLEDLEAFYNFCDGAEHFIAHNIKFDRDFIPFNLKYQFDTMLANIDILKIPGKYGFKWPKLMECANYYNVPLEEDNLHASMYDVLIMARVFYKMLKKPSTKNMILDFIINNRSNLGW